MPFNTLEEIESAIGVLKPEQLTELYAWLDRHRPAQTESPESGTPTVFEQGLGLFGGVQDAALLDEVVHDAYKERRRPTGTR